MSEAIMLDGNSLTMETVASYSHCSIGSVCKVFLTETAKKQIQKSNDVINNIVKNKETVYGVNTGFGLLSEVSISNDDLADLQINLLRSHAVGIGKPLSHPEVKAAMLLRANTLAKGFSGCSIELIEKILELLNANVIPWIPSQGSVGACGDLAPLAHLSLPLIGEGYVWSNGEIVESKKILDVKKIKPYQLKPKEGLSLINGTQIMTAIGTIALDAAKKLANAAEIAAAMSLEAIKGTSVAFNENIHFSRPHPRQIDVAENLRRLLSNSQIAESHQDCKRVQDPYSFRCIPQVHGISREFIDNAVPIFEREFNSATDNPLVFIDQNSPNGGNIISGGNFHGQYIAMTLDSLCIAISELANISEIRIQKLINPNMSGGLPAFLTTNPGVNSGMMIVQVAAASLVSENKILSHPASVDSIPTSADKEDHVSMGVTAARKLQQIVINTRNVLAMEFLCAAQGLEFLKPLDPGEGVKAAYDLIRQHIPKADKDRPFHQDIEKIFGLIENNSIINAVEMKIGKLK